MYILASGESMFPTLENGKRYKFDLVRDADFQIGDIVVYKMDDMFICHRIIKIISSRNNSVFIKTKGDNCKEADGYVVTKDKIIGKINL